MTKLYTKNSWVDETLASDPTYNIKDSTDAIINEDVKIELSTGVSVAGTSLTAAKMNNIEDGLDAVDDAINVEGHDAKTTPVDADEVNLWDSVASAWKSLSWANIKATLKTYFDTLYLPHDGWIPISDAWAYASAGAITVPAGALTKYSAYGKVKFTQHGATKYGYIYPTSDTLLVLYAGSDYVVEDTATYPITNINYSNVETPIGFPQRFAYTPLLGGSTWTVVGALTALGYFSINSGIAKAWINLTGATSIANTGGYVTLPINAIRNDVSFMVDDYSNPYQNGLAMTIGVIYPGTVTETGRTLIITSNYYLL